MNAGLLCDRRSSAAVAGLHVVGLLLLGLHVYVRTLPPTPAPLPTPEDAEAAWWGLWPVTYVPAWLVGAGIVLVLSLMGWGWWWMVHAPTHTATPRRFVLPLAAVLIAGAFFLFPIAHTRWGDAYMLAKGLAWPDPALRLTHSWQAPLDVALHSQVWHWAYAPLGWEDAMPVYRWLSPLAGLIYLGAALALGADTRLAPGWLSFGLLASLGVIQLFFGYVENYSFAAAGVLVYLWLGRRTLAATGAVWLPALVLALTNATHPSTIVLAPSLLYLGWRRARSQTAGTREGASIVLAVGLPMLVVAAGTLLFMEGSGHGLQALLTTDRPGGGDARWFVPLWATTTRWEHYTLLSWAHLRDLLNGQALVAPVVLPSLIWLGFARRTLLAPHRRANGPAQEWDTYGEAETATVRFFAVAAVAYLAFTVVWNPDYGGQRDWDLFSLATVPAALWLTAVAAHSLRRPALAAGMVPLLALQALHTVAWIYQNTLPWEWP